MRRICLKTGDAVERDTYNRFILDCMSRRAMKVADSVPVHTIVDYGIDQGLSLDEVEAALIHASIQEWILLAGANVHLSQAGYSKIGPANDNSP